MNITNLKRKIFKNTFWLGLGEGFSRFLVALLLIYAARILGPTQFGIFSFSLAFVSIFVIFSHFGLPDITTRELARDRKNELQYPGILSLKILLGLGTFILIIAASFFAIQNEPIRKIVWILGVYLLINDFLKIIYSFLRARQQMEYEAGIKILQAIMIIGLGFFVLFYIPSVETLSYTLLFATFITVIFTLILFSKFVRPLWITWAPNLWRRFLKLSWPLGLASAFAVIYLQIDSVMMGFWRQITEVGWYSAAYKIIVVLIMPVSFISTSFYPVLTKLFHQSKEKFQRISNFQIELMIILTLPIIIAGTMLAPRIISFFYGADFSPSILAFQILILIVGLIFLSNPFRLSLLVCNHQKKIFWITLIGAIVNIILNLILIPRYSLYGAAGATAITHIILFFLFIAFSRHLTPISPFNLRLLKTLVLGFLSGFIMFIAINQPLIYNLNMVLTTIIGILIYSASLFIFYKLLPKTL